MTAALVEMKVETKNPSENKSRVPHCERKNGGHQQRGGMVWNAYLLVLNTHALLFLSQGIIQNTSRLRHTYGKCTIERNKNWGKKFEAQSTTTFMPIKYFGMIFVVVWLADRCIGNVQNVVR
jgi:hypothetical protein